MRHDDPAADRHFAGGAWDMKRPDWQDIALCREVDPELFFPERESDRCTSAAAVRICQSCPVQTQCLEWAIDNQEMWGVWGGVSERRRRQFRRAA